jgi:hypothetical protein
MAVSVWNSVSGLLSILKNVFPVSAKFSSYFNQLFLKICLNFIIRNIGFVSCYYIVYFLS